MKNKYAGIYCYENSVNNKKYIGQSIDILKRLKTHEQNFLRKECPKCENELLWKAIKKYERTNFIIYIVELCNEDSLDEREEFYIKEMKSHKTEWGYNILWKGFSRRGVRHSKETLQKFKFRKKPNMTPEVIKKISKANKGKVISYETREKLRIANVGKKHSSETKQKMSIAQTGRKHSEETISKIKNGLSGENSYLYGKKSGTSSRYNGVTISNRYRLYWQAAIKHQGIKTHIGTYKTEIEAAKAYNEYILVNNLKRPLNVINEDEICQFKK